jgi:predicted ATPase
MYSHHRPNAGWQREEQFSDGTLRLLALLWVLQEGDSLLLLEEPELSLNDAIVKEIPRLLQRIQRDRKKRSRQILISTHSEALLSNPGIDGRGVVLLEPAQEGTRARSIDDKEAFALQHGLSVAEVVLPKTRPKAAEQLGLW